MWLGGIVIDSDDTEALSEFYKNLLKWEKEYHGAEDEWVVVYDKSRRFTPLVFQQEPNFTRPIYPSEKNKPQQMLHLDFYVKQGALEKTTEHALSCGATLAQTQYTEEWRVFLDPSGHTFCIIPIPAEMAQYFESIF